MFHDVRYAGRGAHLVHVDPFVAEKGDALSTADPRFAPMQALLDQGWKAYQQVHDVGELARLRVQLVLVDSDVPNAFVAPDRDLVGLAVMVDAGLIDLKAPPEQVMGIVMHEAALRAALPADLRALIEGKLFVQGLYNWVGYARAKMRDIEGQFATAHGVPWQRLRYFSTEEAADDSSVATLARMGLPADGVGRILPKLIPNLETLCRPLVDANQAIPYGENLPDPHHGTCWRAGHAKARAAVVSRRAAPRVELLPAGRQRSPLAGPDPEWMD